jgi:hypothetical protein
VNRRFGLTRTSPQLTRAAPASSPSVAGGASRPRNSGDLRERGARLVAPAGARRRGRGGTRSPGSARGCARRLEALRATRRGTAETQVTARRSCAAPGVLLVDRRSARTPRAPSRVAGAPARAPADSATRHDAGSPRTASSSGASDARRAARGTARAVFPACARCRPRRASGSPRAARDASMRSPTRAATAGQRGDDQEQIPMVEERANHGSCRSRRRRARRSRLTRSTGGILAGPGRVRRRARFPRVQRVNGR